MYAKLPIKLISFICFLFICEYLFRTYESYKYPRSGKVLNGVHYLYIGTHHDSPLVVLVSGCGCSLLEYSLVQPLIAEFARVVSYDRPGLGWSKSTSKPRTLQNLAKDLYKLLQTIPGPYILVGHSTAGIIITQLINDYPQLEVKAVVLVDAIDGGFLDYLPDFPELIGMLASPPSKLWLTLQLNSGYLRFTDWLFRKDCREAEGLDYNTMEAIKARYYAGDLLGSY